MYGGKQASFGGSTNAERNVLKSGGICLTADDLSTTEAAAPTASTEYYWVAIFYIIQKIFRLWMQSWE